MMSEREVIVFGFTGWLTGMQQDRILDRIKNLDWVEKAERLYPGASNVNVRRHCIARIKTDADITENEAVKIIGSMDGIEYADKAASRNL